jgi:hypothetical protein
MLVSRGVLTVSLLILLACAAPARAEFLTFDDLPQLQPPTYRPSPLPSGYCGLTWANAGYMSDALMPGDTDCIVSAPNAACILSQRTPMMFWANTPFDLYSLYLSVGGPGEEYVTAIGYLSGRPVFSADLLLTGSATLTSLNFIGVDEVTISPTQMGLYVDNVSYTITPEPVSFGLMALGSVILMRRRMK